MKGIDIEKEYFEWFQREFPSHEVEIHYSVTITKTGKSVPHVMVSVSKEPEGWVHAFSTDTKPATVEQMICSLQGSLKFWAELGKRPPLVSRLPRQIIQLELEAAEEQGPNLFEVTLRGLLETQLGAIKVTTERVNRYLSMSRGKMYLLLEGVGCKKEQLEQLRKLDV
jgi:hypothetical protein